jgi:hypothetical protein
VGHHRRQSEVVDVPASVDVPGARYSAELLRLLQRAAESVLLLRPGSLVSDTIYDQVVPQVFTDSAMPVNCKIAAGREESDFYVALGVVSEGPIYQFSANPLDHRLDGQPPHGPGMLGLRRGHGHDPVQNYDPDLNSDKFSLGDGNPQTYGPEKAAGTAFLEIRRSDAKGLQLTRLAEHQMQAMVTGGMGGWRWTDANAPTVAGSGTGCSRR